MLVFGGHCCSGTPGGECEDQSGLIPGAARESAMVLTEDDCFKIEVGKQNSEVVWSCAASTSGHSQECLTLGPLAWHLLQLFQGSPS